MARMADVLTRARVTGWGGIGEAPFGQSSAEQGAPDVLASFEVDDGAEGWLGDTTDSQASGGGSPLKLAPAATPLHRYVAGLVQRLFVPGQSSAKVVRSVMVAGLDNRYSSSMLAAAAGEVLATALTGSVCIVDANLSEPSLDRHYDVPNENGFAQFLAGTGSVDDYARAPVHGRPTSLWLLPGGPAPEEGAGLFARESSVDRFRELINAFDHVLIVAPPLTVEPDTSILAGQVDGVVLVADANLTPRETSRAAADGVRASGARVLGTVLHHGNIPIAAPVRESGAQGDAVHLFDSEARAHRPPTWPEAVRSNGPGEALASRPPAIGAPGAPRASREPRVESLLYSLSQSGSPLAKQVNTLPEAFPEPVTSLAPTVARRAVVIAGLGVVLVATIVLLWPRLPAAEPAASPTSTTPQEPVASSPSLAPPAAAAAGAPAGPPTRARTPAARGGTAAPRTAAPAGAKPRAVGAAPPRGPDAQNQSPLVPSPVLPLIGAEGALEAVAPLPTGTAGAASGRSGSGGAAERLGRAAVDRVLKQYEQAFDRLDVSAAAAAWPGVNTAELSRAFEIVRSQDLTFEQCDITVAAPRATAHCTGAVRYVPREGGPTPRLRRLNWVIEVVERNDGWAIERVTATDAH